MLVVGAGLAAAQVVAELRAAGFDGRVRVLGAEGVPPYDHPPLSKHLFDRTEPAWLSDEIGVDVSALADEVHLARPARELLLGGDRPAVRTDDGVLAADHVVIATGAHATRPAGWEAALTLHTAADAERLRAALAGGSRRLVVIGAGWIGAEVAGVAAAAGHEVTVVESAPAPLWAALDLAGAFTARWYDEAGVALLTDTQVAQVRADGVTLADGRTLEADVVLAAVGARPATDWLAGAVPRLPDGSIQVDPAYRVLAPQATPPVAAAGRDAETFWVLSGPPGTWWAPVPGLWAVGDAARRTSPRHGPVRGGHWDGALRGPRALVGHLLGKPVGAPEDDPAPYVFSTQLGHDLALFGVPQGRDAVLRGDPAGPDGWGVLWYTGDRVAAVLVVDRPRDVGAARRLFTGKELPKVDRAVAADPALPLRPR